MWQRLQTVHRRAYTGWQRNLSLMPCAALIHQIFRLTWQFIFSMRLLSEHGRDSHALGYHKQLPVSEVIKRVERCIFREK
ncbi:hypothetical protein TKWG_01195 [Advenella kashmirensis WT001]|uniref:Uncharacterized protein n=1 Tax=Advenella kashmirensis (strain DSM 17095 / LMG 22695 / WT001) TaxID=1036672 RepID=I3U7D0_ADVKW|nr:hypothetical protein TKWG_01195 [Advenella kashmirensis WT001]